MAMPETATSSGIIQSPPERVSPSPSRIVDIHFIKGRAVFETEVSVNAPWSHVPLKDVLSHYSDTKKRKLEGQSFSERKMNELESELVEARGGHLSTNERTLLVGQQWTLGMEGEQPVGGYFLRGNPESRYAPPEDRQKKECVLSEGIQAPLGNIFFEAKIGTPAPKPLALPRNLEYKI